MTFIPRRTLLLAVMAATSLLPGWTLAQKAPAYDFRRLDSLLAASVKTTTPAGGGFGVLLVQDGRVIYSKRFGSYSVDRVVPIASASKWLSGAVIMSLVADGRLSLDDRVGKFFPDLTGKKAEITIRQLFSHTSGITEGDPCIASRAETLATCARAILNLPLTADPGAEFSYGGASMQVAGRIAELAGGEPFATLFRKRIAAPLGLSRTGYANLGSPENPLLGGGMFSSAPEYAAFLRMVLAGGMHEDKRVLPAALIEEMLNDQTRGARIASSPFEGDPRARTRMPTRYGIGVWREVNDSATGRSIEASSPGALGFLPWIDRDRGLAGVLTMQGRLRDAMPMYHAMKAIIRETIPARRSAPPSPERPWLGG
jgi:CubicO group peptidase (beta-lactamase class C family)